MLFTSWYRRLTTGSPTRSRRPRSRRTLSRRSVLPRLEVMEDRKLLSTFMVKNLNDSGAYSLRAGIQSGDATIAFAPGLHGTITLKSELPITDSVTFDGPGANKLSVSGNDTYRIFDISGSASVSISGLTITDGLATSGGGILLEGSAALSISNCTADRQRGPRQYGRQAGFGGGIEDDSSGALTVTNCTFDANKAIAVGPNTIPRTSGYPGYILALGGAIDVSYVSYRPGHDQ